MNGEAERIVVDVVRTAVGDVPVLLCGSRATGEAEPGSDWDVVVVVPAARLPLAVRRLGAAARELGRAFGVEVTLSPLPAGRVARGDRNLLVWKLLRESRVLAAPGGFVLPAPPPPPVTPLAAFSLLLSAANYLLEGPPPRTSARAVRKALLHVAQLRLLRCGRYGPTLDAALADLGDERLGALAVGAGEAGSWFGTRAEVLDELGAAEPSRGARASLAANARYVALSALRGRSRLRAALGRGAIDERLARAARALLEAVGEGGALDGSALARAHRALPRSLRPPGPPDWSGLRDVVAREWPSAHPVLAL